MVDSHTGTWTATYDVDGTATVVWPNGLYARTTVDETGSDTALSYTTTSSCADASCTVLAERVSESLDVPSNSMSIHWAVEADGPAWPSWTAGTWAWADRRPALREELRRRVRVTESRFGRLTDSEVEASPDVWIRLRAGGVMRPRRTRVFTLGSPEQEL